MPFDSSIAGWKSPEPGTQSQRAARALQEDVCICEQERDRLIAERSFGPEMVAYAQAVIPLKEGIQALGSKSQPDEISATYSDFRQRAGRLIRAAKEQLDAEREAARLAALQVVLYRSKDNVNEEL